MLVRKEDPVWESIEHAMVQDLKSLDHKTALSVWKKFTSDLKKQSSASIASRIKNDPSMNTITRAFVSIISFHFISRDYQCVDPYGKMLNLRDCKLEFQYTTIRFREESHKILRNVEHSTQATTLEKHAEAVATWRAGGSKFERPKAPQGLPKGQSFGNITKPAPCYLQVPGGPFTRAPYF